MRCSGENLSVVRTLSCTRINGSMRAYTSINGYTRAYASINGSMRAYARINGSTRVYTRINGSMRAHVRINGLTRTYIRMNGSVGECIGRSRNTCTYRLQRVNLHAKMSKKLARELYDV